MRSFLAKTFIFLLSSTLDLFLVYFQLLYLPI